MRNNPFSKVVPGTTIPGASVGIKNMEEVHEFNNKQIRRKGFYIATGVGNNLLDIKLPGSARYMLGFNLHDVSGGQANFCDLIINNDSRIESVPVAMLSRYIINPVGLGMAYTGALGCSEYFDCPTLLSGNDSITMEFNIATAGVIFVTFFYI